MELSEAKEILEDRDMLIDTLFETYNQSIVKPFDKAIDTVLKALDNSISKDEVEDIYPLTIIKDRYSGAYSGGEYTAWNLEFEDIPEQINDEDVTCHGFWIDNEIPVGKGKTPIEAINNLQKSLEK